MLSRTWTKLSLALFLSACAADKDRPKGGGTVEPGFDRHGLYVANTDHGTIARVDLRDGTIQKYESGKEPSRVARAGDRVYVSNRGERNIAVFEDDGTELTRIGTIMTGAEPVGVVASANSVYVSASIDGRVIEYDADSFEEKRSWSLSGEPRGLGLHKSGFALYVGSTYGGKWTYIDLRSGQAQEIDLPDVTGFNFETNVEFSLAHRITGDPASSPQGDMVAFPALYVDRDTVIPDEPNPDESMVPGGGGYGGRFNPSVVIVDVDEGTGQPLPETSTPYVITGFVNGSRPHSVNGYPVSISFTPDQDLALVAVEGGDAVLALDLEQRTSGGLNGSTADKAAPAPGPGRGGIGFNFLNSTAIATGAGPVGVAVLNDETAYVHALFDRKVQRIDLDAVRSMLHPDFSGGGVGEVGPPRDVPIGGDSGSGFVGGTGIPQLYASADVVLGDEVLAPDVAEGRRLFFASGNPLMSGDGSGVSCATCHFQGRTDGFTWVFERGPRQTPSLAGRVSRYEPVGWMGDRPTVADDAMQTSQGLMGGQGMQLADAQKISAFINAGREIDNPIAGTNDPRIARGAALFNRADVACATCHAGPAYTNNQIVELFGIQTVKVRPLNGIRATAPYLHDGSAPTLRALLERVRDGSMGNTSALNESEMDDLEFYLESL